MNQPIQCTDEDLQELKRLALAVRANSDDDDALGVALDEYDEHANPDQVLCLFEAIDRVTADADRLRAELECSRGDFAQLERISDALQQRLTAADERGRELEGLVRDAQKAFNYDSEGSCFNPGIAFVKPWSIRAIAALKPAEGGGDDTTLEEEREDARKVFVRTNTKQGQSVSLDDMLARYKTKP